MDNSLLSMPPATKLNRLLQSYVSVYLILLGAYLISIQMRLTLPVGKLLGAEYQAALPTFFVVLSAALAISFGLSIIDSVRRWLNPERHFRILLLTVLLADVLAIWRTPDLSQLQLVYFTAAAFVMGIMVIVIPGRVRARGGTLQLTE